MKQIIHSFLYGSAVWAACTVSQEVKAGGIPVSTTEDGDAVSQTLFVWYVKTSVLGCTVSVTVWQ